MLMDMFGSAPFYSIFSVQVTITSTSVEQKGRLEMIIKHIKN